MNIVFLGPPGSGKGTQAKKLADRFKLTHLSTGDVFREAIGKKTELGVEIKNYVDSGKLVPDELVSRVVFEKLKSMIKSNGFLLDGYPRTVEQAKELDRFSKDNHVALDSILFFDVDFKELTKRLSSRRQCQSCKEVYNLVNRPPVKADTCDKCGQPLLHRPDDQPEIVQERLNVYQRLTAPVLAFYEKNPAYHRIDAAKDIDTVFSEIEKALGSTAA